MFILEIGQLVCFHWFSWFSKIVGDIHTVIICISVSVFQSSQGRECPVFTKPSLIRINVTQNYCVGVTG